MIFVTFWALPYDISFHKWQKQIFYYHHAVQSCYICWITRTYNEVRYTYHIWCVTWMYCCRETIKLTEVTASDKLESFRASKEVYVFLSLYLGMGRKLNSLFIIHISKNMNHEGLFKMKIFKLMTLYYFSFFVIFAAFQRLKFSNYFISWSKCGNHTLWTKCRNLCRVRSRQNLSFWFRSTGFSAIINNWFIAII